MQDLGESFRTIAVSMASNPTSKDTNTTKYPGITKKVLTQWNRKVELFNFKVAGVVL